MERLGKYLYTTLCFVMFLFADLFISGYLANHYIGLNHNNPLLKLTYIKNSGAAFNILPNSREFLIILSVVAITLFAVYIVRHVKGIRYLELFFIAMLSAGIAGNLHERIIYGFVRDFFQLKFINFPVFNVSDILITIGVVIWAIIIIAKKAR